MPTMYHKLRGSLALVALSWPSVSAFFPEDLFTEFGFEPVRQQSAPPRGFATTEDDFLNSLNFRHEEQQAASPFGPLWHQTFANRPEETLSTLNFPPMTARRPPVVAFLSPRTQRVFAPPRPVVVHAGPMLSGGFGLQEFSSLPLQSLLPRDAFSELSPFQIRRDPFSDIFDILDKQVGHSHSSSDFHVEQQGGHFKLQAVLPGYKMHSKGMQEDQPLSVEVIGHSLVVRGQQTRGMMMQSFQRSFRLPQNADPDGIHVTYNVSDGALAVDIPAKAGTSNADEHGEGNMQASTFDLQDPCGCGSQTSFMISSGSAANAAPMLQDMEGGIESLLESFFGFPQRGTRLGFLAKDNTDHRPSQLSGPSAAQPQPEASLPKPLGPPSESKEKTPLVVQRKDAKPFWRLTGNNGKQDASFIEIVLPEGVEVGELNGQKIPVHGKASEPLELPVAVKSDDCQDSYQNLESPSKERVIQCKLQGSTVKKLTIDVVEEL